MSLKQEPLDEKASKKKGGYGPQYRYLAETTDSVIDIDQFKELDINNTD